MDSTDEPLIWLSGATKTIGPGSEKNFQSLPEILVTFKSLYKDMPNNQKVPCSILKKSQLLFNDSKLDIAVPYQ